MKTKITELLGIKYPIIQGGMAWTSDANLAAAVSNAGGAGIIATGGRTVEWTRDEIRKAKDLTAKPFGVNIMLMAPNIAEIIDVVCEEKVAFVTLGAGNPVPHIEKFHAAEIKVIPVVPSVKLAKRVEEAGVDAMVIEGMEGGGHIGQQTTMALMTNVLPLIKKVPVLVAGGISDGRGIAAALMMGADGVQMGSRFILTDECPTHPKAKEAIIKATDTDSAVTGFSRNNAVRCLKNEFTKEYLEKEYFPLFSIPLYQKRIFTAYAFSQRFFLKTDPGNRHRDRRCASRDLRRCLKRGVRRLSAHHGILS